MPDFSKNLIYKICCDNQMYIGHTTNLYGRIKRHQYLLKNNLNSKLYNHIKGKFWFLEIIEMFPCKNLQEANEREEYWIKKLSPTLNTNRAYRTPEIIKKCNCEKSLRYYYKHKNIIKQRLKNKSNLIINKIDLNNENL